MKSTLGQERIIDEEKMKIHLNEYKNDYFSESIKSEFTKETSNEDATDNKIAVSIEYQINTLKQISKRNMNQVLQNTLKQLSKRNMNQLLQNTLKQISK